MVENRWGPPKLALPSVIAVALLAALFPSSSLARDARAGSAPARRQLQLVLPLRADIAGLERFAREVTTIASPLYGDYLPLATLEQRFGASRATRSRVVRFLRRIGARAVRVDRTGLFADATMSVSLAQRTFRTSLARFDATRATGYIAPASAARIPRALRRAVTGVVGLDTRSLLGAPQLRQAGAGRFPHTAARFGNDNFPSGYQQRTGTASGCSGALSARGFTPNQYLTAYDYAALEAGGVTGQNERVALIEIDGFRYSDLRAFASCFNLRVPAINGYGVGLNHPLAPGGESTLDLEVLDAAAPGLKEIDVYESMAKASNVLQALTAPLQNSGHVPEVISASLGTCEPALQVSIGASGVKTAEAALAMAAASGISVLASSGDAGSSACENHAGPIDALAVSYPASSPFVTGVGGTNLSLTAANTIQSETVWNDAPDDVTAGGGGLSKLFKRPSYQKGFDASGQRAVPDVSMLADVLPGYDVYCTAKECLTGATSPWIAVGGTSAASPLMAAGVALIDQLLREHGRQDIGLVNPLLYEIARRDASAGAFLDVVTNDDDLGPYIPDGNHKALGCCSAGPGFDYASGLGSVDLGKLAALATTLVSPIAHIALALPAQSPAAVGHIVANVSCSRRCIAAVVGQVKIAGGRTFGVGSRHVVFGHARRKSIQIGFTLAELTLIKNALLAHRSITASVAAEVVDAGGNIEAHGLAHTLRITS